MTRVVAWDLWIDYHRRDADGLTHGNVRNAGADVTLTDSAYIVVGNDEADPAVGEMVRVDDDGVVLVRVLPGSVDDNRSLLRAVTAPR